MTHFPPDYTHNLLPIDAQMTLRDAHARCQGIGSADKRADIIDTAERRVRAMCPDAYMGDSPVGDRA